MKKEKPPEGIQPEPEMVRAVRGLLANPQQTAAFHNLSDRLVKEAMEAIIKRVENRVSSSNRQS